MNVNRHLALEAAHKIRYWLIALEHGMDPAHAEGFKVQAIDRLYSLRDDRLPALERTASREEVEGALVRLIVVYNIVLC